MNVKLDQAGRVQPGDELSFEQHEGLWVVRPAMPTTVPVIVKLDDDDLNWPDMDYESPRPKRVSKVVA